MKSILFLILSIFVFQLCAQQGKTSIDFQCTMNGELIELGQKYYAATQEDSIRIDVLRFYISELQLIDNKRVVYEFDKKHILLDLEKPESFLVKVSEFAGDFNQVKFKLGIDSLTNISGAMSGDLDPMHGMYWTWQSGYINFKMEGQMDKCPARKGEFQFHLGGYQGENLAIQTIELAIKNTAKRPVITFPIDKFFKQINLQKDYRVMSPSAAAVKKSQLIACLFEIK